MEYYNKVIYIQYSDLHYIRKGCSPYLLCFSNGDDPINKEIIELANSRCQKYKLAECFCIKWEDYKKIKKGLLEREQYSLAMYRKGKMEEVTFDRSKSSFDELFKIVDKNCKTNSRCNVGLHLRRELRSGLLFLNETLMKEYKEPESDNEDPIIYKCHHSREVPPCKKAQQVQPRSQLHTDRLQSTLSSQSIQSQHVRISLPPGNIQPSHTQPSDASSQHHETHSALLPFGYPMLYPQPPPQHIYPNTLLDLYGYQPYYHTQTDSHTNPNFPIYNQPLSTVTSPKLTQYRPYLSEQSQTQSSSSRNRGNVREERRQRSRSPTHQSPPKPYTHSIKDILGSSSFSTQTPTGFIHDEFRSAFTRPCLSSSTQSRSATHSSSFASPSHTYTPRLQSRHAVLVPSHLTQLLPHQTASNIIPSISSVGRVTSYLSTPFHRRTPYDRPPSRSGRQTSPSSTHTDRNILATASLQLTIQRHPHSQQHDDIRNRNPSSQTLLFTQGQRTGNNQRNRSPNRNDQSSDHSHP